MSIDKLNEFEKRLCKKKQTFLKFKQTFSEPRLYLLKAKKDLIVLWADVDGIAVTSINGKTLHFFPEVSKIDIRRQTL